MKQLGMLVCVIIILVTKPVWADKYVSDVLRVSIKDAASDSAKTVKVVKSGARLEVLDSTEVQGYLRVKASTGEVGWVSSRFLQDEPIAADRIEQLEKQLQAVVQENQQFKEKVGGSGPDDIETDRELKRILSENQQLLKDNERLIKAAENPAILSSENEALKKENAQLQAEYQTIKSKFDNVSGETQRTWFMIGAGVLFTGIILGLIFPNLRFRRRSTWS